MRAHQVPDEEEVEECDENRSAAEDSQLLVLGVLLACIHDTRVLDEKASFINQTEPSVAVQKNF